MSIFDDKHLRELEARRNWLMERVNQYDAFHQTRAEQRARAERERKEALEAEEDYLARPSNGVDLLRRIGSADSDRHAQIIASATTYARTNDNFANVPAGDLRVVTLPRYLGIADGPPVREKTREPYITRTEDTIIHSDREVIGPPKLNPPTFSFDMSQLPARAFAYRYERQAPVLKDWLDRQADVERYLGRRVHIQQRDAHHIEVIPRIELPAVIAFDPKKLRRGQIFFGTDVLTGEPVYASISELMHTFAFGRNGEGKSAFLNHAIVSLLFNADLLDGLTLIDLKHGLEYQRFEGLLPGKLTVAHRLDQLPELIGQLSATMEARSLKLKAARQVKATSGFHFVIIDEFAPIELHKPEKTERERYARMHAQLLLLVGQGRAPGMRIWAQLQHPVDSMMSTEFRSQLQNIVAFRVLALNAAQIFEGATDLPLKPSELPPYQCVLALHGQPKRVVKAPLLPDDLDLAAIIAMGQAAATAAVATPAADDRPADPLDQYGVPR